jgi:hypothetical protein
MAAINISGAFVYQPAGVFDVVLVVVDDEGNPALLGDAELSLAVVLSYPDQFLQQVGLDLFIVDPLGYGGVRVGATWPDQDPEPPEGWAPAALLATVTSGYVGYSAVITAAQPAPADSGIFLARPVPGQRFPAPQG